ncbi:PEP-CTERM sorting domain-containing protein [Magnetospirillum moscoviense]|uniref:PEP-CTERM protein-sorting domain-containing protein n=1 Tax=Magnetospirillum moscoviense TaxID=1437059 RepID=A0A178MT96_9PROT|nr:PEP-CTERM sorting domain-containing protein [Magnetospirillum moscoviense]MBF0324533.1 PEP-CTERM sorting domain-containing protein [Alphaproteobacteria bacterium]OAN51555.1 hypothetical protein A6A05_01450 [Magnetospirillum moscoviense]
MAFINSLKYAGVISVGILAIALGTPAQAGEITIDFTAASPIGSGITYDLTFTLNTADYINAHHNQAAPTIANPSAVINYGAYTINSITGSLTKILVADNSVLASGTLSTLQPVGTVVGANNPTDNLMYPLLASGSSLILDGDGNAQTDTGPAMDVNAFAFDDQGFAFLIGSQLVQLTADLANTGLYVLTTPTVTVLLRQGSTNFQFESFSNVRQVPAPAPLALLGVGLLGLGMIRRRKNADTGVSSPQDAVTA